MAYPPVIYPQSTIPDIPTVYPGTTTPIPSSILEKYHSDCTNQYYQIYGSKNGNIYDKCFIAQYMRHDGTSLTGFGIRVAKRGAPGKPLLIGVTIGGPPDDPLNLTQYVETWQIPSSSFGSANAWYWVFCFLSTPLDVTHYTPMVVAASTTDYNSSSKTGDYLWGVCFGIASGLDSAEHYLPQTLSANLEPTLACQGGTGTCLYDGVDMVSAAIYDQINPNVPVDTVVVEDFYEVHVALNNGSFWCENFTLDFYWDNGTTLFGCYLGSLPGYLAGGSGTFVFTFQCPSMIDGEHQMKVKMREKPSASPLTIGVFVVGGPYEWSAAPDTAAFFSYTEGTPASCTNPAGVNGDWHCDGTTKMVCTNGSWVPTLNSPDCQAVGCKNPTGENGDTNCLGNSLYKCQDGSWKLYSNNALECMGCTCGNFPDSTTCEGAAGSQGEQCCFWYQKYFWEPATCHSKMQDYLTDYLPILAIGVGAAILLIALSTSRKTQYIQAYYPPPQTQQTPKKQKKR